MRFVYPSGKVTMGLPAGQATSANNAEAGAGGGSVMLLSWDEPHALELDDRRRLASKFLLVMAVNLAITALIVGGEVQDASKVAPDSHNAVGHSASLCCPGRGRWNASLALFR